MRAAALIVLEIVGTGLALATGFSAVVFIWAVVRGRIIRRRLTGREGGSA